MEIISKTPERIVIRTDNNYSLLNAVRRSVEEIPVLAIDEVEIFKNDSALYDEVLAHRIGLIPLKNEGKVSSKSSATLSLKKSGPCTVYSGDFKGDIEVVYDSIPITILEKDQEIELSATVNAGNGLIHAKYVPGLIYYRNLFEVKSGNVKIDSIVQDSKGPLKPEKKGNKWTCDLTDYQAEEIKRLDKESISDSSEFLLFVESFGILDSDKILAKSIESLQDNLESFEKSLK
jgi:DNA-directed RNA polymerase subunit D